MQVITISEAMTIFIVGTILAIIAFLIQIFMQRVVLKKLDENEISIKCIGEKQASLHLEVVNNFVKKDDHEEHKVMNEAVHNKIWEDLGAKGERLAKVEERVSIRDEIRNAIEIIKGG